MDNGTNKRPTNHFLAFRLPLWSTEFSAIYRRLTPSNKLMPARECHAKALQKVCQPYRRIFIAPYTLDGYKLSPTGALDNDPMIINYGLEEGESVTQVPGTDFSAVADSTRTYTYVGRETVDINGVSLEACRVDSETRNETDRPEFRLENQASRWYAVGSGLLLKRESLSFPDSEDDIFTVESELSFGSVNSVSIF